jgi:hypothetical protein
MGVCERKMLFEHRYGKRPSDEQLTSMRRGLREHQRFYRDRHLDSSRKGRCYVATLVFGESWQTQMRIYALCERRDGTLAERVAARQACSIALCATCVFRSPCKAMC